MNEPTTEPELPRVTEAVAPAHPFVVRSFGLTDSGKVRPSNEDCFLVAELARTLFVRNTSVPQSQAQYSSQRGHIFLVADGMGGHQAGEKASALSVITIETFLLNSLRRFFHVEARDEQNVMKQFQSALLQADARIFEEARRHPELLGMGTTLTLAFAVDWRLFVAHVGDSRCYLFSGGKLQQLTEDHTMVGDMVRRGLLSPEEAARSQYRNVITNALGGHDQGARVELHRLDLAPADVILVCSDGLTGMVPDDRITAILTAEQTPQKACERLVVEANSQGGKDNISVIVARFDAA